MAPVHVHRSTTEMVSSVKQSATRAFVTVPVLLARGYEMVLAVSRDSSKQELLKAHTFLSKPLPKKGHGDVEVASEVQVQRESKSLQSTREQHDSNLCGPRSWKTGPSRL